MTAQPTWHEAEEMMRWLRDQERERRLVLLLSHLPLADALVLAQLAGLGPTFIYHVLDRLREAGLIGAIRPPLRPGSSPRRFFLTDLALATLGLMQGVEPEALARRYRLRGRDLLALLPSLRHRSAAYDLLGAVATSHPGRTELLAWEQPWRRRYQPRTRQTVVSVTLPACVRLSWDDATVTFLLIPDLGTVPLRLYRTVLDRLFTLRRFQHDELPTLVIAADGEVRAAAWQKLLDEARRLRREAPLLARVVRWDQLSAGLEHLPLTDPTWQRSTRDNDQRLPSLRPRSPGRPLPRHVGNALGSVAVTSTSSGHLGWLALSLGPVDHALLDLVARHPFLTAEDVSTVLDCSVDRVRRRLHTLIRRGLLRLAEPDDSADQMGEQLLEVTGPGLELVADHLGMTLTVAVRECGLAGGGPDEPVGARRTLMRHLAHTRGVDRLFIALSRTARQLTAVDGDDALVGWQNAAACSRRHLRPDGYGMYRRAGQLHGFFLEYDRGTMNRRDYFRKFAAYYYYAATRRFEQDYQGYPTILVIATDNASERRIAGVAARAARGRHARLPLFLTSLWRIESAANPHGLLGRIWREPQAAFDERGYWLPTHGIRRAQA